MPRRKNPFLGFGRGGYFSTSRTYRLGPSSSKSKGKGKGRSSKPTKERDEDESESEYGKYYERLSLEDKEIVRRKMRGNPGRAKHYIIDDNNEILCVGSKVKCLAYYKKHGGSSAGLHLMYPYDEGGDNKLLNKGTVLIIKNPAPWFGGRGSLGNPIEKEWAPDIEWLKEKAEDAGIYWGRYGAEESGVANARVRHYGFLKFWNSLSPKVKLGKGVLERKFNAGYALGKRHR